MNILESLKITGQILAPNKKIEVPLPDLDWETIVSVSSHHLVTPALYPALVSKEAFDPLPEDLKRYLSYVHELNVDRNTTLMDQGAEIARVLNPIGITPVMLKGMAYLFSDLHRDRGARVVGDIDCFVPQDKAEAALDRLQETGYTFLWDKGPELHHHLPPLSKEGSPAVVELHTHPIKRDFAALISVEDFIAGVTVLTRDGAKIGLPSPTHQALICIEHEGLANRDDDFLRVSLRGLHDLACLVAREEIDWQDMASRFQKTGLSSTLRRYLALARGLFHVSPEGFPVPSHFPLFIWFALKFPRARKGLVFLSLGTRFWTDARIRRATLTYGWKVLRKEDSLFSLKRQMANKEP